MTSVRITMTRPEWGLSREAYEALADALRADGYTVTLVLPPAEEQRGRFSLPGTAGMVADALIHVGEHMADGALDAMVALAIARLRRKTKRQRSGVIYGPDGEELRRFSIPADDD